MEMSDKCVRTMAWGTTMALKLGYKASAEQFPPQRLLDLAVLAERSGFESVWTSDHFQPWRHTNGHAPNALVWLGAGLRGNMLAAWWALVVVRVLPAALALAGTYERGATMRYFLEGGALLLLLAVSLG